MDDPPPGSSAAAPADYRWWPLPAGAPLAPWLLGISVQRAGAAAAEFVLPAHGLLTLTRVAAGRLWRLGEQGRWLPQPAWTLQHPQRRATRWRMAPGTRLVAALWHGALGAAATPPATGDDAAAALAERLRWGAAAEPAAVAAALAARLGPWLQQDPGVQAARAQAAALLAALRDAAGVAEAAARAGLSPRTLQRRCDAVLGLPPALLLRLARLHRSAGAWLAGGAAVDAAVAAGYFDQPHMLRDWRLLASTTPGRVARGCAGCEAMAVAPPAADADWPLRVGAARLAAAYFAFADGPA